ncbi:hypothetical protein [Bacillus sp. AFS053548]|uniref:hypothetical protein n=1 Tax=Bacillus sp. AFS053548 TaxID=2033505 RepID=UPI000BFD5C7B|nr:hypothetical protein [Bacillus sp. AFS053548]PGM56754.1 hypothetical protein CN946_10010 [Bacillus sp. AFS053548]
MEETISLQDVLKEKAIPLTILLGQEVRLYGELIQDFELKRIVSINDGSRYLLCELPSSHIPQFTNRLFY